MENFIVSARKYRPVTFKSVVGQESITNTLKNSIRNNHLAQAFLFCGPRGVGKTTCARILAKTINCFNLTADTEPCNECESCISFNQNASFNIHELDAASNNSVDDIRALIEQVRFAPQVGNYSIYIIDEVHMLSSAAFNAFLKTLEEPPKHAIFILATTERHKILPTILSRCQVFTFNRIKVDDIAYHLDFVAKSENIVADADGLHVIAQKADGGLRDALSMFDQMVSYSGGTAVTYESVIENLNVLDYDYYFRLTEFLLPGNYGESLMLLDTILSKGFDGANFLVGLGEHLRNLLICQDAQTLNLLEVSAGVKSRYQSQSHQWKPVTLIQALEIVIRSEQQLKTSKSPRLTIELCLLLLSRLNAVVEEKKAIAQTDNSTIQGNKPAVQKEAPLPPRPAPTSEERRPVINFRGVNPIKTVSIQSHINKPGKEDELEDEKNRSHSIIEELPVNPVNGEMLLECWKKYCEELRTEGRNSMYGNLTLTDPVLKDGTHITYVLQNESQLKEIEFEKPNLLGYLRKHLQNYNIKLELIKAEAPLKNRPFTQDEKLKAMEEKNPNISLLRKKLGLQPE